MAYRKAADSVEMLRQDLGLIFRTEGFRGLREIPGVGSQIAGAIAEIVRTGRWMQLERLRGSADPEALFASVPGIGDKLAKHIVSHLHIETLEALETELYSGRLRAVPGFGQRRIAMTRSALAEMLGRSRRENADLRREPAVEALLSVDREYREKAAANVLRRIAPRRFNPTNAAWLPILHTERIAWQFTALFSNTGLAHNLGRTHDWVVIHFHNDSGSEGQRTVVTETQGPLKGERVVRGREKECADYESALDHAA
jgi:hypothetical protein